MYFIPIVYLPYKIIIWNKLRHTLDGSLKCGFQIITFPMAKTEKNPDKHKEKNKEICCLIRSSLFVQPCQNELKPWVKVNMLLNIDTRVGGKRLWNLWNLFRLWVVDVKRCIYVAFSIFIGIRILLCRQDVDNQDKRRRKNWSCDIFWEKFSV